MTQVILGENEGIDSALRRFKRQVSKAEIFADMKKKRHFETPLEKERRKAVARRKKRFRSKVKFTNSTGLRAIRESYDLSDC